MKRSLGVLLGMIVSGVVSAACGGEVEPQNGTVKLDGTKTPADAVTTDTGCYASERRTYDLDPGFTCATARELVADCARFCGAPMSCGLTDAQGAYVYVQIDQGSGCAQKPVKAFCEKSVASTGPQPARGCAVEGRRPDGLHAIGADAFASVADYFANAAHLEAAAVLAFERLGIELEAHGAPAVLLARVRRAELEERRHVVLTSELARGFGKEPTGASAEPYTLRSPFEVARENMIEGVVRETYGAAIALFRAERAADAAVREALREIAMDECRHAELSWDLHAWLSSRLTEGERAALEQARIEAIAELGEAVTAEPAAELARVGGVPTAKEAIRLHAELFAQVWSAAA